MKLTKLNASKGRFKDLKAKIGDLKGHEVMKFDFASWKRDQFHKDLSEVTEKGTEVTTPLYASSCRKKDSLEFTGTTPHCNWQGDRKAMEYKGWNN